MSMTHSAKKSIRLVHYGTPETPTGRPMKMQLQDPVSEQN